MKEVWRFVKTNRKYQVSSKGRVRNSKTKRILSQYLPTNCLRFYVGLNSGNQPVNRLVLQNFRKTELDYVIHENEDIQDNKLKNLDECTRGDALRQVHRFRKRKRGVYKFEPGKCWRVALKVDNKAVTLGYAKTKKEAEYLYIWGYEQIYGVKPL